MFLRWRTINYKAELVNVSTPILVATSKPAYKTRKNITYFTPWQHPTVREALHFWSISVKLTVEALQFAGGTRTYIVHCLLKVFKNCCYVSYQLFVEICNVDWKYIHWRTKWSLPLTHKISILKNFSAYNSVGFVAKFLCTQHKIILYGNKYVELQLLNGSTDTKYDDNICTLNMVL